MIIYTFVLSVYLDDKQSQNFAKKVVIHASSLAKNCFQVQQQTIGGRNFGPQPFSFIWIYVPHSGIKWHS